MNNQQLKDLTKFSQGDIDVVSNKAAGLCKNFGINKIQGYKAILESWEHYSGNFSYPIPPVKEHDPQYRKGLAERGYKSSGEAKYKGKGLELRIEFAKHILNNI